MRLSNNAIQILGSPEKKGLRTKLALKLDFTERWVLILIAKNQPNSPLTTAGALRVIREETGLKDEQILEETEPEKEKAFA